MNLEQLLLSSYLQNEDSENAFNTLEEMKNSNLNQYINDLVDLCQNDSTSALAKALAFIYLYRVFDNTSIAESGAEIFEQICEFSFPFITNSNDDIAQQSSSLFGLVSGNLIRSCINTSDIIEKITSLLQVSSEQRVVHYALVALREILSTTQLEQEEQSLIFSSLMNLTENPCFVNDIIDTLTEMADDLSLAISNDDIRNHFLELMLSYTANIEIKPKCYLFWEKLADKSWSVFHPILNSLFEIAINDLNNSDVPDVITNICLLIKVVSKRQRKEAETIYINSSFYDSVIERLFTIMISTTPSDIDSPDDWGPYQACYETISSLSKTFKEHSERVLPELIEAIGQNEEDSFQEALLFCIYILSLNGFVFDFNIEFQIIAQHLQSSNPRLRISSSQAFTVFLDQFLNKGSELEQEQKEAFLSTIDLFSALVQDDVVPCVCNTLYALCKLALIPESPKGDILELVFNYLSSENIDVSNAAFLSIREYLKHSPTNVSDSILIFPHAIQLFSQSKSEGAEDIFEVANSFLITLLSFAKTGASTFADEIFPILFEDPSLDTFLLICCCAGYFGSFVEQYAQTIVEIFSSLYENIETLNDFLLILSDFLYILNNPIFEQYMLGFYALFIQKYSDETLCETENDLFKKKTYILSCLSSMMKHFPIAMDPCVQEILEMINTNLLESTINNYNEDLIGASLDLLGILILTKKDNTELFDHLIELAYQIIPHLYDISLDNNNVCNDVIFLLYSAISRTCIDSILGFKENWELFDAFIDHALHGQASKTNTGRLLYELKRYVDGNEEEESDECDISSDKDFEVDYAMLSDISDDL